MRHWWFGLLIFSLCLRVATLGLEQFWYDEAFTAFLVKLPFPQLLAAIKGDVHPPLWYLITWGIGQIAGRSEFVLRLPAALFGTGVVMQTYSLVKQISTERAARWASGLMAIVPGQLYYSQEARMYSLLTLLVLLGAGAVVNKNWLRLALCCALIGYTQNLGLIYSGILGLWGLWKSRGQVLKLLMPAAGAYMPWGFVALQQSANIAAGFWIPPRDLSGVLYYLSFTTIFTRLPEWLLLHGIVLVMTLTFLSIFLLRHQLKKLAPIFSLAFLPPLLLYAASQVWHPVLLDRALLPAGAAVVTLWGMGLSLLPRWSTRLVAAIGLPMAVLSLGTYYADPMEGRPRGDPVIPIVDQNWQTGDALYHLNLSSMIGYDYYLDGKPAFMLPEAGDLAQSLSDATKAAMGLKERELRPDLLRARGYKRIWLFVDESPVSSDYEMQVARSLPNIFKLVHRWEIYKSSYAEFRLELLQL